MVAVGLLGFLLVALLLATNHPGRALEVMNYLFGYFLVISIIGFIYHDKVER